MKSTIELLNRYGGAWDSGGGGSGSASFASITGAPTDNAALVLEFQKRGALPTTEISNSSNSTLTPTVGTPVYVRRPIKSDIRITKYEKRIETYTSSGVLEIGMYTGSGSTTPLTQIPGSVVQYTVTASGYYELTLSSPLVVSASQNVWVAGLAVSGSYTFLGGQSARNNASHFCTGATLAAALPATESTRNSTNVAFYVDLLTT